MDNYGNVHNITELKNRRKMKDCHKGNLINVLFCVFSASFHEGVAFGNEKEGIGQIWGSFCHFYFAI